MNLNSLKHSSNWRATELERDQRWIFRIDDQSREEMIATVLKAEDPNKTLLDYRQTDFSLGKTWPTFIAALEEVKHGFGVALVKGLPRKELNAKQFEILTWALGLHAGVPRPQGKETHYISAVRDAGVTYRSGTGRGYSSHADLDFHTDSSDVVFLSCFNQAVSGGKTIVCSSMAGHDVMAREYPEQLKWLYEPIAFSRQPLAQPEPHSHGVGAEPSVHAVHRLASHSCRRQLRRSHAAGAEGVSRRVWGAARSGDCDPVPGLGQPQRAGFGHGRVAF